MPHVARLRKVGGSVMLAIPPALLEALDLAPEASVNLTMKAGKLVVERRARPRYSLDELLAQCDPAAPFSAEDREWLDNAPVGREAI